MKIKKLLVCAVLILPLVWGGTVYAQHDEQMDSDKPTSNQATDTSAKKTREQRVQERKEKVKERLSVAKERQVKLRCKAANGLIKSASKRIGSFEAKRKNVYGGAATRLQELSPKLQAAGIDTATFDEQVAILKTKAEAYNTALAGLKTAVEDLGDMDCAADPQGFMATLMDVKEHREDVIAKGLDFRSYLKNTVKPTLRNIKQQLEAKKAEKEEM
jgi:hypothetical protein